MLWKLVQPFQMMNVSFHGFAFFLFHWGIRASNMDANVTRVIIEHPISTLCLHGTIELLNWVQSARSYL